MLVGGIVKIPGVRNSANFLLCRVLSFSQQEVARLFGPNRLMFGSDWPVCRLAGFDHKEMQDLANQLLAMCGFNRKEVERIFYDNAIAFYNIKED